MRGDALTEVGAAQPDFPSGGGAMLWRVRRSFQIHAGVALVAGGALILLAVLTWVPGLVPPRWASGLPFLTALLGFPLLLSAFVRLLLARADRTTQWTALRCLPGVVQLGVAGLAVAGALVLVAGEVRWADQAGVSEQASRAG